MAGKGLSAALLMCAVQASLRALTELDLPPEETMARLNRLLARRIPANRFVTFFYGILDPGRHSLIYVNAGHNPPSIMSPDGSIADRLAQTGRPLGLFEQSSYRAETVDLLPGEILLGYSDGVTEEQNAAQEEFGEARLVDLLRTVREGTPFDIVHRITTAIAGYHGDSPRQDDITLVVLKRAALPGDGLVQVR